jgi:hypothetical protein
MRLHVYCLASVFSLLLLAPAPKASAQISIGINLSDQPNCPYGYYDYAPYNCSPYGYYGPEWFNGGAFIGAGRWFHGPAHFNGHVNNAYDPQHGYKGQMPGHAAPTQHPDNFKSFKGNESRDGQGHAAADNHGHK